MKRLWFFNPENDIALAHGSANFTPPKAAVRLQRSGALLPLWLGESGDKVLCDGVNESWLEKMSSLFNLEVAPWDYQTGYTPEPWGWSAYTCRCFEQRGLPLSTLPDAQELEILRNLSHRRTAALVASELRAAVGDTLWPIAQEVDNADMLEAIMSSPGDKIIKAPWSSSGRGIIFVKENNIRQAIVQAAGIIRNQGSVMIERCADRLMDFAMLFTYHRGDCRFEGYSLFNTNDRGAYIGNVVAEQSYLEQVIELDDTVKTVRQILPQALKNVLGDKYSGPVGVDMLYAKGAAGSPILDPVVEINLRYTMGFVALRLSRLVSGKASYSIEPGDVTDTCHAEVSGGRLVRGTLALTPPGGDFTFLLSVDQ